jgi:hypothetical protein
LGAFVAAGVAVLLALSAVFVDPGSRGAVSSRRVDQVRAARSSSAAAAAAKTSLP